VNPLESLIVIVRVVFIFIDVVNLRQADILFYDVHGLPAGNVKGLISTSNAIIQFPKYCATRQLGKPGASKQKTPKPKLRGRELNN
jgi:hypothetical protein